jgi:serine/threonine-protein kinase PpkA
VKNKKVMIPKIAGVISVFAVCLFCLVLFRAGAVSAQPRSPLLIPGKRTLYQKVITHPGAKLFAIDGDALQVLEGWIKPFTVYYVYERASVAGEPWLEIGLSSTEGPMGWINGTKTSDWNQALTLVFTDNE